jgi:hypothetical protein
MKNKIIKVIALSILTATFALNSFGQTTVKTTEECGKKPTKIEKKKVPTVVTETYFREYPVTTYESWLGYPVFTNENDWYGYNPYLYSNEYPEYYIVEFTKDKTPHKVIYSKAGKKVATHKKLNADVPKAISLALSKGEYGTWKLGKEKEEIFKDSDKDDLKIYKVEVEKGKEKHILFYASNGDLLKDKTIKQ